MQAMDLMVTLILSYSTIDEAFGGLVEREGKFAKRVVFAVHRMYESWLLGKLMHSADRALGLESSSPPK